MELTKDRGGQSMLESILIGKYGALGMSRNPRIFRRRGLKLQSQSRSRCL